MAAPALVIRVAGNLDDFKKTLRGTQDLITSNTANLQKFGSVDLSKPTSQLRLVHSATDAADKAGKNINTTYRQFDGILQSLGINIGPYVKGLEDITNLATQGAKGLGFLGGAAATVATALASWKIGTHIGEFTGWTEAIARGTAVLKGYGDVAQQTMLAQIQSAELSGHAERMWKLQAEGTAAATKAAQEHTDEMRREGMVTAGNAAHMTALANQLKEVEQQRRKDAEQTRLAAHEQAFFGEQAHFTTEVIAEQTDVLNAHLEKLKEIEKAKQAFMKAPTLNDRPSDTFSFDVKPLSLTELNKLKTKNPLLSADRNLQAEFERLALLENNFKPKNNKQFFQHQRDMYLLEQLRMFFGTQFPNFASGVKNFRGGPAIVGERGPELVNLPRGSDVIPNHQMGAPTVIVNATINYPVMDSPRARHELGRVIGDIVMRRFRSGGGVAPEA